MKQDTAIIVGAGPAGLTTAHELLEKTEIKPIIYEKTDDIGGISKTVEYKGNRIDIGGHRFFSKSDKVMEWWKNIFPVQRAPAKDDILLNKNKPIPEEGERPDPEVDDEVMLLRSRLSRIYYLGKFFDYPISLSFDTLTKLGLIKVIKIALSYARVKLWPIKEEKSLEDFFINRFGRELYSTFFRDYTEKVWGVPCDEIKPEWGEQRIKGLSVSKAVLDALKDIFTGNSSVSQKDTETSLIKQFMYPKLGPGQLWEKVAHIVEEKGGEIHKKHEVVGINPQGDEIVNAKVKNKSSNSKLNIEGDYFFSTMPVKNLIESIDTQIPKNVKEVSQGLMYRDFITVGVLLEELEIENQTDKETVNNIPPDNWIYVQEKNVKLGRIQIFNNWSPYMVKDYENTVWIGLEYFCNKGEELWDKSDKEFAEFAIDELSQIDIAKKDKVLDSTVLRMPKTYPAYFGSYERFDIVRDFVNQFKNLYLVGRNGMHRYNNSDHSMLSAIKAVENVAQGRVSKDNIWEVNTEEEYHEKEAEE